MTLEIGSMIASDMYMGLVQSVVGHGNVPRK